MNPQRLIRASQAGVGMGVALAHRFLRRCPYQPDLLESLRQNDEWLLIILDACRYDMFDRKIGEVLDCTYEPVWSSGRNTFEYIRNAWPGGYPEVTYLSAAPAVNANSRKQESDAALDMFRGYVASEHISNIKELFDRDVGEEIGTCPPEVVTEEALETQSNKMVAHYFQPHAPYIGEERLVLRDEDGNSNTKLIWDAVRQGELDTREVMNAYQSNLNRTIHSVAKLVDTVATDNIVITADHGEALGEYHVLSHPDAIPFHPKTRIVPWAEVNSVKEYDEWDIGDSVQGENKDIKERLSQLGYF